MKKAFTRSDTSIIGSWWWTIDKWLLTALLTLIAIGIFLNFSASPAIAERLDIDPYHFIKKQMTFLPASMLVFFILSLQSPKNIKRLGVLMFIGAFSLTAFTLIGGIEIKGARRWINLGLTIQPSEFLKPTFAIVSGWMFATHAVEKKFPGNWIAILLYLLVAGVLLSQPDVGMTLVISAMWGTQFFIAGLPFLWVAIIGIIGISGVVGAYFTFDHVQIRVDRFLGSESAMSYQVKKSLQAFENGGLFGTGPGEGLVKQHLPDAHTDFILAVAGEEFGVIFCLIINLLFALIVLRGLYLLLKEQNLFVTIAGSGLLVQFGLQAIINMASTLHLMPTKGMTLPFISYGGSSLLSLAIGMGMIFALTRSREGSGDEEY